MQLICKATGEKENVTLKCHKQSRDEEIFITLQEAGEIHLGMCHRVLDFVPQRLFESQQVQQSVAGKGRGKGAYFRQGDEKYPLCLAKEVGRGRDACL